jgi:hypothetical protein
LEINWLQVLLAFGVGILATLVGQLVWAKLFGPKDFTVTYTEGDRTFTSAGKPPETVDLESLVKILFRKK